MKDLIHFYITEYIICNIKGGIIPFKKFKIFYFTLKFGHLGQEPE